MRSSINAFALPMLLLVWLGVTSSSFAQSNFESPNARYAAEGDGVTEEWKEQEVQLPSPPRDDTLVLLELEYNEPRYDFYLDSRSLSLDKDQVSRYVVVIESRNGARNVLFEGVRCNTGEFRTYAFAGRNGAFRPYSASKWLSLATVPRQGPLGYRISLARDILCDRYGSPGEVEAVLRRVRNGDAFSIEAGNPNIAEFDT